MDYNKLVTLCFAMHEASFSSTPRLHCLIGPLFNSRMKLALCLFTRRPYYLIRNFFVQGQNWQELIKGFAAKLAADSPSREQQQLLG